MATINELLYKLNNSALSPAEAEELEALLLAQEPAQARQYLADSFANAAQLQRLEPSKAASMLEAIIAQQAPPQPQRQPRLTYLRYVAAAAVLLAIAAATWLWQASNNTEKHTQLATTLHIPPGGNKATLTLADGRTVLLDSTANGLIGEQNGAILIQSADGQLSYPKSDISNPTSAISYNLLSTPRGGQYRLILPDGTRVWLNAASTIRYPAVFTGNSRMVTISGEAYLEVARDAAHPFIVQTHGQQVAVLGTGFNINAYDNEGATRTTLLEGSIRVAPDSTTAALAQPAVLLPGQQAIYKAGSLNVQAADVEAVMAWKNGLFHFHSAGIQDIMRQVERWYDVEVVYEGKITTDRFSGKVSRSANISELLKVLQESGVHFKIENQKIIVLS